MMKQSDLDEMMLQPWRREKRVEIVIGIDPGVNMGFAAWSKSKSEFLMLETLTFWQVYDKCTMYPVDTTKIIIEKSDTTHIWGGKGKGKSASVASRIGQNVAAPKVQADLLKDRLTALGFYAVTQKPAGTKMAADLFKRLTGYQGRTNEHNRDAGVIAFRG